MENVKYLISGVNDRITFFPGFNRSIPLNPRYDMIGDGTDGVHHLRIKDASLKDDAEYECQVGPKGTHSPIKTIGTLKVLSEYLYLLFGFAVMLKLPFRRNYFVILHPNPFCQLMIKNL